MSFIKKAFLLDDKSYIANYYIAMIFTEQQEFSKARPFWEGLIDSFPNDVVILKEAGWNKIILSQKNKLLKQQGYIYLKRAFNISLTENNIINILKCAKEIILYYMQEGDRNALNKFIQENQRLFSDHIDFLEFCIPFLEQIHN